MGPLTYKDETGKEIKTAHFLRNRGSCCKTACRHCPYGFTLREKGLQFCNFDGQQELAQQFLQQQAGAGSDLAANLLAEGMGRPIKPVSLSDYPPESLKFILLKGTKIGLAVISGIRVKEIFLSKHYQHQGIDIPTVESFYF